MFIVKAGDDLRQEQVAMQIISLVREIFKEEGLDLWLRPYTIVCVGDQAGESSIFLSFPWPYCEEI